MIKLDPSNFVSGPISEGDVGLIIKPDGSHQVFTTGNIDSAGELTPEQEKQGKLLMAIVLALQNPDTTRELLAQLDDALGQGFDFVEAGEGDFPWLPKKDMH